MVQPENITESSLELTPTTALPWWSRSSFPYSQYKELMPEDEFEKLIAMHENSATNAAMYVAIVLAVYIVLLSLLLCRYVRRRPPPREIPPPFSPHHPSTIISQPEEITCSPRSQPTLWERMVGFVSKPYDALRHCTLRSGAGVASISSEENDEERCSTILPGSDHGHRRRDSAIRMNQITANPKNMVMMTDRKGSSITVNISMDQEEQIGQSQIRNTGKAAEGDEGFRIPGGRENGA